MIASPHALRPKHSSSGVARPYLAPRRRQAAGPQSRRPAACRSLVSDRAGGKRLVPLPVRGPRGTIGHAEAVVAALTMAFAAESFAERTQPTSPPARFRDLDVRTLQASGTSNVDLEALFDGPGTGNGLSAGGTGTTLGLQSFDGLEAGSALNGALWAQSAAPTAEHPEIGDWLGGVGGVELFAVPDHA